MTSAGKVPQWSIKFGIFQVIVDIKPTGHKKHRRSFKHIQISEILGEDIGHGFQLERSDAAAANRSDLALDLLAGEEIEAQDVCE